MQNLRIDELRTALKTNPHLEDLTERQYETLKAIVTYRLEKGQFPTNKELGLALGVTGTRAQQLLGELASKDYVSSTGKRRGLVVNDKGIEYYAAKEGLKGQVSLL